MRSRSVFALLFLTVAFLWAAPVAHAQDGDVFLIISLEPEFDTTVTSSESGSDTIIVRIGSLTSGVPTPGQTRFQNAPTPPTIPLPGGFDLNTLNGNEATIFGSFTTEEFESVEAHMVTPVPAGINPLIQAAAFAASATLAAAIDPAFDGDAFMTTGEIAGFVHAELPEGSEISLSEVAEAIFGTDVTMTASTTMCDAEGGLFPHEPDDLLFEFEFSFDDDGDFSALDVCLHADVEVKENSINLKKKGSVAVTIYASDNFDIDDIDEDMIEIGGVAPDKVTFSSKKVLCHFSIPDLVAAGVLDSTTTEVTLTAFLVSDGSCIEGTAPVNVK